LILPPEQCAYCSAAIKDGDFNEDLKKLLKVIQRTLRSCFCLSGKNWLKGGPEPLEKESHEFLGSKRDDRCFNPFFEMVPKTCQGSFFVPALA